MYNNQSNHINGRFAVEERRRQVASLLAQSKTETEIAAELGVSQVTIFRDIKVLKEMSQQFVYQLAKSNLAFYYQQCIESVEQSVYIQTFQFLHETVELIPLLRDNEPIVIRDYGNIIQVMTIDG
jgi:IS30 family transposase